MERGYIRPPYADRSTRNLPICKKILARAACLIGTAAVALVTYKTDIKAGNYNYDSVYEQLVTKRQNTAEFTEEKDISGYDVLLEVIARDSKDDPYDGATLYGRGTWVLRSKGSDRTLTAENSYNVNEADKVASEIADTIKVLAGDDATDRELFYEYLRYMDENFHFDKELGRAVDEMNRTGKALKAKNFVEAYYGDKGLNCNGYTTLTYLVCDKLGIDCEIISGNNHTFNSVKFSDSDKYIAFDLTKQVKYAGLTGLGVLFIKSNIEMISKEKYKELTKKMNEGKEYTGAGISEFIKEYKYFHKKTA